MQVASTFPFPLMMRVLNPAVIDSLPAEEVKVGVIRKSWTKKVAAHLAIHVLGIVFPVDVAGRRFVL